MLRFSLLSSFALVLFASTLGAAPKSLQVDTASSKVIWVGKKKIIKSEHHGLLPLKSGLIRLDAKSGVVGGSFELDMTKLSNEDLKDDPKNQKKLLGHLSSDDFFSVEKFPTSQFKILSVTAVKNSQPEVTHTIQGELTIKGKTAPLSFPAKIQVKEGKVEFSASKIAVDRTKYGVRYGSDRFFDNLGDKVIDDFFYIDFELKAS